jgi:Fe2+ transport system protein FeoA
MITLNEGKKGITYKIVEISKGKECKDNCPLCLRLRLMEFLFIKGERVEILREGEPMMVRIGNTQMGLRGEESQRVQIQSI